MRPSCDLGQVVRLTASASTYSTFAAVAAELAAANGDSPAAEKDAIEALLHDEEASYLSRNPPESAAVTSQMGSDEERQVSERMKRIRRVGDKRHFAGSGVLVLAGRMSEANVHAGTVVPNRDAPLRFASRPRRRVAPTRPGERPR